MAKGKYAEWIEPDGLIKIQGWARDGLTNEQIAHNIGVNPDTLYTWMKRFPDISDALKTGKEVIDRQVENALLKNALGYSYDEVTQERVFDEEEGEWVMQVTKIVKKEVNPNTTAQIFFLKNRKPDEWRDKRENTHMGADGGPIQTQNKMDLSALTPEELKKLAGIE